jgi:tetratricopeptide (TPR) repeat protein
LNQSLSALGQRFVQLSAQGDHAAALAVNAQARAPMPEHPQILGDAALCHLRLREYDTSYALYRQACALGPQDVNLWDGLTEVCGHMGRHAEVREHGLRSLQLKDALTQGQPPMPVPVQAAVPNADRLRQVIAFSLFGDNPRYGETAKLNVMVAQQLLPQWVCRFYVDDSVPEQVRRSAGQLEDRGFARANDLPVRHSCAPRPVACRCAVPLCQAHPGRRLAGAGARRLMRLSGLARPGSG